MNCDKGQKTIDKHPDGRACLSEKQEDVKQEAVNGQEENKGPKYRGMSREEVGSQGVLG